MLKKWHYSVHPLIKRAGEFYKRAVEAELPTREESYRKNVAQLKSIISSNDGMMRARLILKNWDDLLIKDEPTLKMMLMKVKDWMEDYAGYGAESIVKWFKILKEHPAIYEWMSKEFKQLARSGALYIDAIQALDRVGILNKDDMDTIINYYLKVLHGEDNTIHSEYLYDLERLMNSKNVNKKVIMRILRTYDPLAFGEEFMYSQTGLADTKQQRKQMDNQFFAEWTTKSHYTTDDAVFLLQKLISDPMTYETIRHIIETSTPASRSVIKQGLYEVRGGGGGQLFIFDEQMQPMDENYQHLSIAPQTYIARIVKQDWQATKNEPAKFDQNTKLKWGQIFADLSIMAYGDTF